MPAKILRSRLGTGYLTVAGKLIAGKADSHGTIAGMARSYKSRISPGLGRCTAAPQRSDRYFLKFSWASVSPWTR
jgi:hypothetical protein